ncbi:MAG: hypothetical protein MJE68_16180, partial [Proteobacteria bacterium]|nr:hypothetical protein [Pseudomonadota bacterium]
MFRVPTPTVMPGGFNGRSMDLITPYDTSSQPSRRLQPTPTLIAFSGYGSAYDDYVYLETTEDATFPSPVSSSTATPDVIIRLRLSFESNITADQRTQVGQTLSDRSEE